MKRSKIIKNLNEMIEYYEKLASLPLSSKNTEYHWRENCSIIFELERLKELIK